MRVTLKDDFFPGRYRGNALRCLSKPANKSQALKLKNMKIYIARKKSIPKLASYKQTSRNNY
jgi:hypothetical protein